MPWSFPRERSSHRIPQPLVTDIPATSCSHTACALPTGFSTSWLGSSSGPVARAREGPRKAGGRPLHLLACPVRVPTPLSHHPPEAASLTCNTLQVTTSPTEEMGFQPDVRNF